MMAFKRTSSLLIGFVLLLTIVNNINGQFIHIFEVQDENRAPKSDLFDPAQYKYVSPAQLQKQQDKLTFNQSVGVSQQQSLKPRPISSSSSSLAPAPTNRPLVTIGSDYRTPIPRSTSSHNSYSAGVRVPAPFGPNGPPVSIHHGLMPHEQLPPNLGSIHGNSGQFNPSTQSAAPSPIQPPTNVRLSTLNSVLHHSSPSSHSGSDQGIPSSLLNSFVQRTQQHQSHHPGNAAQPPYTANIANQYVTPAPIRSQIPLHQPPPPPPPPPSAPSHSSSSPPIGRSINGAIAQPQGLTFSPPSVTNKESLTDEDIRMIEEHNRKVRLFLQQRQSELAQEQDHLRQQKAAAEEAAALKAQQQEQAARAEQERLRRLREEQEAAIRAAEQDRIRRIKAEQEAASRAAAEQERIRRIKAEQEAAAVRAAAEAERIRRIKEEQEAAARAAAEADRIRRYRAEQEAAARAAAEQERIRRIKAEQEAAARAAEDARIRRIQAEQEAAAKAAAEQERLNRLKAEQEAAARAAAEADRIRRYRAEQEAAARAAAEQDRIRRIKAEQEQIRRLREEQESAARAAAEQDRIRRLQDERDRLNRIRAEQESSAIQSVNAEQERLRQLRAQQEAAARLAEAERERLTNLRAEQEIAAIRARYQTNPLPMSSNLTSPNLSYQPEPNLGVDEYGSTLFQRTPPSQHTQSQSQPTSSSSSSSSSNDQYGLVDSARLRAEKEALAEQERLLRFQASQQALAQQQAQEQARLRRLREQDDIHRRVAEEERAARDAAQTRMILRARQDQTQRIQSARSSDIPSSYNNYSTDDINRYPTSSISTNYTGSNNVSSNVPEFRSLNNVRTPEPRGYPYRNVPTNNIVEEHLPTSEAIQPPSISSDYVRRVRPESSNRNLNYGNETSSSSLSTNRLLATNSRYETNNSHSPRSVSDNSRTSSSSSSSSNTNPNYKAAKISLQELPPDLDADGIPGVAGKDYPKLTHIPKTSFNCGRQPLNGYYADTETACQVVHMCQAGGVQDSFLCPNGTIWNQEKFACQWWYEVSCATAPSFYALNNNLYKGKELNGKPIVLDSAGSTNSRRP
ncbi:hypothetical protein RDWZM_010018 [Blomia tropicalis]|uniref:Chitin-binding type-2 domain-containing protein n=1 Tax=Blomia tropicalis TaxID=40697 RepID=A0A9Q0LYM1_BLOTA|nr:hypothetical protein RDWZM_010018 [Blomia tropicalis]